MQMKSDSKLLAPENSEPAMINQDNSKVDIGDNEEDIDEDKPEQPVSRQELFVYFMTDKDLQHHETISIKASLYKGIAVKMKSLNQRQMENILFAVETAKDNGIVNLRFEECRMFKKAVQRLMDFCKTTSIIESLILFKVTFDDGQDFKKLVEAVSSNQVLRSFAINHSVFDEDFHGKMMSKCMLDSRSIKELDLSYVIFEENMNFYEMANGLLNEKCRLQAIKLRGVAFNQLEGKVMQYILERNKSLQTLDISQCHTDSPENLDNVFKNFDSQCNLRTLVAENIDADFNYFAENFGSALGQNTKLEGLSLKENKLKQAEYCSFWSLMTPNRSLKKINVTKTELNDRVCAQISTYLKEPDLALIDINLSRNLIQHDGLIALAEALKVNTSLVSLNLAQNLIREGGIKEFVDALKVNNTLQELCLSLNKINNAGLEAFSGFLAENSTLQVLDLSKNIFSDNGFVFFAKELGKNTGIVSLNLSKNKDISDEAGLRELANSLSTNSSLAIIDLTGVKIRKPCVIQYFQPALKQNITLKRIIGKVPPGIISDDLKDNVTIESDVELRYKVLKKENRRELNKLPLHRIDGLDYTLLNLMNMGNELLIPALKFIRYRMIMGVDVTNMQLEDEQLRLLALYLEENPILRSLSLAENYFTDDGFSQIIKALRENTNLNHLNIQGCTQISNVSLRELEDMVTQVNMSLYAIDIDEESFDKSLMSRIQVQAKYNKAIQEYLKPVKMTTPEGLIEIKFDPNARIAQHFDAAIKSWRILGPSMIKAVNEGLTDDHVEKLCNFLANRNLIESLNLRRNKIGNKGAMAIAEYIRVSDKTLVSLELERNQIQDEGGEALLIATQSNMRIECCMMSYGNPMRQKICRQIEREIKANLQIKSTVFPRYKANNNSLAHYEESDRGPDFVRCALKSCELFKILHLSLPDNMIGEKEMNDIAYVLQRNTPLKTLNLSDNVVDAKAAKILANALGYNSHLREIDLRNNKLGDSGIAVLVEPFILQKILKFRNYKPITTAKRFDQGSRQFGPGEGNELDNNKAFLVSMSRKKMLEAFDELATRKLKMKVERLLIDNNEQSEEALKHIYTALIVNQDIEIQIDLPESEPPLFTNDSLSEDEKILLEDIDDDDDEDLPHTQVAPAPPVQVPKEKNEDDSQASDEDKDKKDVINSENEEQEQVNKVVPPCCKMRCCRPCRQLCFRDKRKPKKSCSQICCRSFLVSRIHATTFKMTTKLLEDSEQGLQRVIFVFILSQFLLFLGIGMVLPFMIRSDQCTIISPFAVYGGYAVFLILSALIEIFCFFKVKGELKCTGSNSVLCSSYMVVKWFQGQLASLASFLQICFVASIAACHWEDSAESIQSEAKQVKDELEKGIDDINKIQPNNIVDGGLGIFLGVCAVIVLIVSNIEKVRFVFIYISPQPHIHQIMPNTMRNAQLAWLCNFKMLAVVLESTSLSEYMIDLGGPVVPGKMRMNAGQQDIAETLTYPIMKNRLKLQDLPMALILTIFLVASIGTSSTMEIIVILVYIGITLLHALCCFIAQAWPRNAKHVNYHLVSYIIQERIEYHNQKREEQELRRQERRENGKDSQDSEDEERSINDTEKSNGLDEVIDQLSALDKSQAVASGLEDTKNLNKTDDDKDNIKSNRTNDDEPIDIGNALKQETGDKSVGSPILDIDLGKSVIKLSQSKK